MAQLTLVALYGHKPPHLARYLNTINELVLRSPLGPFFRPYALEQIHATIVGLERTATPHAFENANRLAAANERATMDFARALHLARTFPPLTIRFGGFKSEDKRLASRGQSPSVRSFQIQAQQGKVIIVGWHHRRGDFSVHADLWTLRRQFGEEANVWPKYAEDSDLFVTLGELTTASYKDSPCARLDFPAIEALEATVRRQLARHPIDVPITPAKLSFVRYIEPTLVSSTSTALPVLNPDLNASSLAACYEE